jgi:hypothetical protein
MKRAMWLSWMVLWAPAALAGKKSREPAPEPAPVAAPADEVTGRPAGVGFLEMPCPYTAGSVMKYRVSRSGRNAMTGTVELSVVEATPGGLVIDVRRTVEREAVLRSGLFEAALVGVEPAPQLRVDLASGAVEVTNLDAWRSVAQAAATQALSAFDESDPMMGPARERLADDEMWRGVAVGELEPLFTTTCGAKPVGMTNYIVEMASPVGGPPVEGAGTINLRQRDPSVSYWMQNEVMDEAAFSASIGAMVAAGQIPPEAAEGMRGARHQTEVQAEITAAGVVRKFTHLRATTIGEQADDALTTYEIQP